MDRLTLATTQLGRMRGMTRYYHERFFADIRYTTALSVVLLLIGWWGIPEAFLLVPPVALLGANQTAFDASYLHFARHYAASLESDLNEGVRKKVLVAAELEDRYLYPLNEKKIVTAHLGWGFSWFGWMTILYTFSGALAFLAGLALGLSTLTEAGSTWTFAYLGILGVLVLASVVIGGWWFVAGTGESRLKEVLDAEFGRSMSDANRGPAS